MTTDELRKRAKEFAEDRGNDCGCVDCRYLNLLKFGAIVARECLDGHGLIDPHGETAIREIAEALEREDA